MRRSSSLPSKSAALCDRAKGPTLAADFVKKICFHPQKYLMTSFVINPKISLPPLCVRLPPPLCELPMTFVTYLHVFIFTPICHPFPSAAPSEVSPGVTRTLGTPLLRSLHAEALQEQNASEAPCVAARAGFEHTNLRSKGIGFTNEPPRCAQTIEHESMRLLLLKGIYLAPLVTDPTSMDGVEQ